MTQSKRVAVFPGTFDPMTNGHLDVIQRGARLFDELIVAVGENPEKVTLLDLDRRARAIRDAVSGIPRVRVETFRGLTVDMARSLGAGVILRGLRNSGDLGFEFQSALTNLVVGEIETLFVMTSPQHAFTSSSLIRQVAQAGGDVSAMVPPQVLLHIQAALKERSRSK